MAQNPSKHLLRLLVAGLVSLGYFMIVDPYKIGAVGLIIGFLLMAVLVYLLCRSLFKGMELLTGNTKLNNRFLRVITTAALIMLLALKTTGQLTVGDMVVTTIFVALLSVYLRYFKNMR